MVPGMGTRRCRSSGQPPASCQRASTRSWRAAITSRSLRASACVRPLPRHRHQQPRRLVIEIEMPGNAAGAPLRAAARNRVTSWAGPLTVSRLRSQSVWTGASGSPEGRAASHRSPSAAPGCQPRSPRAAMPPASGTQPARPGSRAAGITVTSETD
jgi:hypothetical protein